MNRDELLMNECLDLAIKGSGFVSPNPLVGCIIVKNDRIIGTGYHKKYGEHHAEVNAIIDAKKKGTNLKGASLYVNLEPCSHTGKTPACSDLIIKEKISNVYIGLKDPNKLVNGKGIKILKEAGIKVATGILEKECREVNKFFIKSITRKRPYITLKIAQSLDGKIALYNNDSRWISSAESRIFVHKLRSIYDGVIIGKNTALIDNPHLTVRNVSGRNPFRLVLDRNLNLPDDLNLFCDKHKKLTYVITNKNTSKKNVDYNFIHISKANAKIKLSKIISEIYKLNISSLMVEGGASLFSQFIKENLFDDAFIFIASKILGKGILAFGDFKINRISEAKSLVLTKVITSKNDLILYYKNTKGK